MIEPAREEEEPAPIEVAFSSEPTGASVTIDGASAGVTPARRALPAGVPVRVRFRHIGYKEETISFTPNTTQTSLQVNLEKDHLRLFD